MGVLEVNAVDVPGSQMFRRVMSQFCTGIVIVTSHDDHGPIGLTCQSFSSVSVEPPLVLFCPANSSTSWPRIRETTHFCVNVLGENQGDLSAQFAKSGGPKFDDVPWVPGVFGAPRIAGAIAHIDCALEETFRAGDHDIVIGRVHGLDHLEGEHPLLYFQSRYSGVKRE
jgi:3-hydroxy-9,10-secoandrosta-1,3,5(10)-triene-9,17-dione monooxygenase reductase component